MVIAGDRSGIHQSALANDSCSGTKASFYLESCCDAMARK